MSGLLRGPLGHIAFHPAKAAAAGGAAAKSLAALPLCRTCAHFRENEAFAVGAEDRVAYGHCALYGAMNVVTGERSYEYAAIARGCSDKCGLAGAHYEPASPDAASL